LRMIEIRFHGRGGQGAWTASILLARSALQEGKHVQSFPEFTPERMGAPVVAYTRIGDEPVDVHSGIYAPGVVVVLDPTLVTAVNVLDGLSEEGVLIVNERRTPSQLRTENSIVGRDVWTVPATDLSVELLGRNIPNTAMLGATVKATGIVRLDSLIAEVKKRFPGKVGEVNTSLIQRAYDEVRKG
jgi:pyruvate ferredoxin oxidoreductase gamma subunit